MDELANPYRPGAGTSPPALLGRDELIDHFGTTVRRALAGRPGKSVMPIGLRGVGKTVLLNRFAEIAEQEGLAVGFIEAPESGDFRVLLVNRLRKILLAYDNDRKTAKVLKALRVLKTFTLQLPDGSRFAIDVDALAGTADSGDLSEDVTDLLLAAGEAAQERDSGLLLAVDEVQYLAAEELAALITAIHRTTQQDLPVVLVGAGLPQLPGLAGDAKSYAERLFEFPQIGSLERDDARAAIVVPAADRGVELTDRAVGAIIERAQGYPYFLQEWGYHVWNAAGASPVEHDLVEAVTPRVVKHLDDNFFLVRFDRLTPAEKTYLRAMAELGPGPHRSGDIAGQLGVRVESVAPRRSGLISKGMVYSPAHGDTAFTVPLFDDFLRREMS
ncbi:AAA family ATPase [Iamia sp.]|uniref:AAA family ATPase n=1 Tax=Iamia sp. TaxID=2722710 RepID=UPI002BB72AC0|nr:AAA family ATPase [Iamia sp.]HXH57689.1 AAA family ATPase [Iamia sp.]